MGFSYIQNFLKMFIQHIQNGMRKSPQKNNEVTNIKGRVYCLLTNEMRFVSIFFNYYYYIISVDSKASAIRISSGCVNLIFLRSPSAIYKGKRFSSAIKVYKDCAQIDFCSASW